MLLFQPRMVSLLLFLYCLNLLNVTSQIENYFKIVDIMLKFKSSVCVKTIQNKFYHLYYKTFDKSLKGEY